MPESLTDAQQHGGRLLFVITSLDYGGAESVVVELAERFKERGWAVGVVSLVNPRAYENELRQSGIEVHSLSMPKGVPDPRAVLKLARIYRQFRPDVVHSHMVHANLLARVARLFAPVPALISTAHNVTEGGAILNAGYRVTDALAEFTTNVSQVALDRYVQLGLVKAHKSGYVPNGVNLSRYTRDPHARAALRRELEAGDHFVWLTVGRITEQKDYPNLFEALRTQPSDSRVWIVGDGELRAESERAVDQHGLGHRVRFLGVRGDVAQLMSAADGFVLASAWEGLPMVLLEAAASELPAVATEVGGVAEIVRPPSGSLVPARDPTALSHALTELEGASATDRAVWGAEARSIALQNFGIEGVVARWEGLFRLALSVAAGRRTRLARKLPPVQAHDALAARSEPSQ